jgi:3-isopropylmalate dehydrogenase
VKRHEYRVVCLTGEGIGPELMAEASRALGAVSGLHGFGIEQEHVPFGREALSRSGHRLPMSTRAACRRADAVLTATTHESALDGVRADLDLRAQVTRVVAPDADVAVVSPLGADSDAWTVERVFRIARARRARLVFVGLSERWSASVATAAEEHSGVLTEPLPLADALLGLSLDPGRFDLVLAESQLSDALVQAAAGSNGRKRFVATGQLSEPAPGLFGPSHGRALDIAGQGVANPSEMFLAVALMLAEGLGERAAARTLEAAVGAAFDAGVRTPDMVPQGTASTTREFVDVLLGLLPSARTDVEFAEVRA